MKINKVFEKIKGKKIIIIGDSMVDSYVLGEINRNSPEAPVPIVDVKQEDTKLGGAANVALNIQSLGMEPILCSVIGDDKDGENFLKLCKKNNLDTTGIIIDYNRKTTNKKRVIVNKKHILRIDNEETNYIEPEIREKFVNNIEKLISNNKIIIFQDYDKGVISKELIEEINKIDHLFIAVDPKKRNFFEYKNVDLFKPNLSEMLNAFNSKDDSIKNLNTISDELKSKNNIKNLMITLSDNGLLINNDAGFIHNKIENKKIIDVSGAGDTVISLATILFYLKLPEKFIAEMCNLAGGITCMSSGVSAINLKELTENAERNNLDVYL
ncbi:MAG: D-glycero-beta-D-manno-heptose-7-phosphate kinase [Flammeovirgaceae bacterium]|nr:D-glycero-beta-D-manno-heptose-7-phosphate kinase [Flammeovirgaceae bacterium]|tara:strand:- start:1246 stop:2223 length:978 start_codon:yes stop_codon:yes gene_type:complete